MNDERHGNPRGDRNPGPPREPGRPAVRAQDRGQRRGRGEHEPRARPGRLDAPEVLHEEREPLLERALHDRVAERAQVGHVRSAPHTCRDLETQRHDEPAERAAQGPGRDRERRTTRRSGIEPTPTQDREHDCRKQVVAGIGGEAQPRKRPDALRASGPSGIDPCGEPERREQQGERRVVGQHVTHVGIARRHERESQRRREGKPPGVGQPAPGEKPEDPQQEQGEAELVGERNPDRGRPVGREAEQPLRDLLERGGRQVHQHVTGPTVGGRHGEARALDVAAPERGRGLEHVDRVSQLVGVSQGSTVEQRQAHGQREQQHTQRPAWTGPGSIELADGGLHWRARNGRTARGSCARYPPAR